MSKNLWSIKNKQKNSTKKHNCNRLLKNKDHDKGKHHMLHLLCEGTLAENGQVERRGGAKDWAAPVDLPKADAHKKNMWLCSVHRKLSQGNRTIWLRHGQCQSISSNPLYYPWTAGWPSLSTPLLQPRHLQTIAQVKLFAGNPAEQYLPFAVLGGDIATRYISLWCDCDFLSCHLQVFYRGWGGSISFTGLCWLLAWNVCRHVLGCCLGNFGIWWGVSFVYMCWKRWKMGDLYIVGAFQLLQEHLL